MKAKNIIMGALVSVVAFTSSCKKDIPVAEKEVTAPVFLNPTGSSTYVLLPENDNGSFETFAWSDAYLGEEIEASYEVQIDDAEGDFSSAQKLAPTKELFKSITSSDMNQLLRDLNIAPNIEIGIQARVVATGGESVQSSVPVSMLVKRYIYSDEVPTWTLKGTASGDESFVLEEKTPGVWEANLKLSDGNFKFYDTAAQALVIGSDGTENGVTYNGSDISVMGGTYNVTLDLNEMKYYVSKEWQISGTALEGNILLKYDEGSKTWKKNVTLNNGSFLFSDTKDVATILGSDGTEAGLVVDGTAIAVTEGDYTVTLDVENNSYAIDALEYPGTMNIIGDAVGGWNWGENEVAMVPVNGMPHMFWKVVWLEGEKGYKFNPDNSWAGRDFTCINAVGKGIFDIGGGDNLTSPAESGYYMIVVDLEKQQVSIDDHAVYISGGCVGWAFDDETLKLSQDTDNKTLTITKDMTGDVIRMYAKSPWIADWWRAEFQVFSGKIEYRANGGDQAAVSVVEGSNTVTLNFTDETGSIVLN